MSARWGTSRRQHQWFVLIKTFHLHGCFWQTLLACSTFHLYILVKVCCPRSNSFEHTCATGTLEINEWNDTLDKKSSPGKQFNHQQTVNARQLKLCGTHTCLMGVHVVSVRLSPYSVHPPFDRKWNKEKEICVTLFPYSVICLGHRRRGVWKDAPWKK